MHPSPAEAAASRTAFARISVRSASGALGAEIGGVDLSRSLDEATFAEIRRAFLESASSCQPNGVAGHLPHPSSNCRQ